MLSSSSFSGDWDWESVVRGGGGLRLVEMVGRGAGVVDLGEMGEEV